MEPAVVVPVDPAGGGVFDVGDGLVRAVVEDGGAHAFGFVEPVNRLHQGVVVGIANGPDRWGDLLEREVLGQHHGRVLAGLNRWKQHLNGGCCGKTIELDEGSDWASADAVARRSFAPAGEGA